MRITKREKERLLLRTGFGEYEDRFRPEPYRQYPTAQKGSTPTWSEIYRGVRLQHHSSPEKLREARKLRQRLARLKGPAPRTGLKRPRYGSKKWRRAKMGWRI